MNSTVSTERPAQILPPLRFEWNEDLHYTAECHPPSRVLVPQFTIQTVARHFKDLCEAGYRRMYMPNMSRPNFRKIKIPDKQILTLREPRMSWKLPVHSYPDAPVDGLMGISYGEGVTIFAGGCLMIIISISKPGVRMLAVLHGHRDLLINRADVIEGKPTSWRPPNVIEQAVEILKKNYDVRPGEASLQSVFGIHPRDFAHDPEDTRRKEYTEVAEYNSNLSPYLQQLLPDADIDEILPTYDGLTCLNTSELVRAQALQTNFFRKVVPDKMLPPGGEDGFVNSGLLDNRSRMRNEVVILCPPQH